MAVSQSQGACDTRAHDETTVARFADEPHGNSLRQHHPLIVEYGGSPARAHPQGADDLRN